MAYSFERQLEYGNGKEDELDLYFSQWYEIKPATMQQQRSGLDRIFTRKDNGEQYKIEYKADTVAHKTGNAFIETISVDKTGRKGWAYTSAADYLIYFVVEDLLAYVVRFDVLRERLPRWENECQQRQVQNKGYKTHGLLVPLMEFEKCATQTISM